MLSFLFQGADVEKQTTTLQTTATLSFPNRLSDADIGTLSKTANLARFPSLASKKTAAYASQRFANAVQFVLPHFSTPSYRQGNRLNLSQIITIRYRRTCLMASHLPCQIGRMNEDY